MTSSHRQDGSGEFGKSSLVELQEVLRSSIHERLRGAQAADPRDVEEVLVQLLAYALALEHLVCRVSRRTGTIPGHNVSVRGYVEQVLGGESSEVAWRRLADYLRDAQYQLFKVATTRDKALEDFAGRMAEELRPERIEERARPSLLQRMLGMGGQACWEEYRQRFHSLDRASLKQLAERQGSSPNGESGRRE